VENRHTALTKGNFYSYAWVAFAIGMVTVGFGAIDLLMVGVIGIQHVAAVGQGDLIATSILVAFVGFVDVFAARLATFEGAHTKDGRQIGLAFGFLATVVICALVAVGIAVLIQPVLVLARQVDELITPISEYVAWRLYGTAPFLVYLAASEALKISGLRTHALRILLVGFCANAGLNTLFLYSSGAAYFASPETAVAAATVVVHVIMGTAAAIFWGKHLRVLSRDDDPQIPAVARRELAYLLRTAPGISARLLNDYAGSVIPILFIGTMNTTTVAAAAVATKVYSLFCRVPQAFFSATFVHYSYGLEKRAADLKVGETQKIIKKLMYYAAWPTAIALVMMLAALPSLIQLFGGNGIDVPLASSLLLAYLIFVPIYFIEQFYGELLTAHARAGLLFKASTMATYLITIPIAYLAVFHFDSAFFAILGKGVSVATLAVIYWSQFYKRAPSRGRELHGS
jgi:Na+-driven multidrug efflux pump